jgi:hypothetical protein
LETDEALGHEARRRQINTKKHTMKNAKKLTSLFGLGLALLAAVPTMVYSDEAIGPRVNVVAVEGQSDWWILPPAIPSKYVTFHPDGSVTMRDMPLAGNFEMHGDGISIQAVISGELNADLDPTFSGPIYGPVVVTQTVKGKEKIIFKGQFFGTVNSLLASGQLLLRGVGQYAGTTVATSFQETEANSELFLHTGHLLDRHAD